MSRVKKCLALLAFPLIAMFHVGVDSVCSEIDNKVVIRIIMITIAHSLKLV